ncbi:hypothetical protein FRC04_005264 [Tulasnella sp. 424]|nr:hypothetical protein FRC04_005264 [Tulasnella sp. 424]KAG8962782.1 hypothetical protein FRC05_005106 [Tulasnella sp. 425]
MADLAALHFSGDALKWYESLDDDVQQDWNLLRKAVTRKYGDERTEAAVTNEAPSSSTESAPDGGEKTMTLKHPDATENNLLPARVEIISWDTPVLVSNMRFPKSEGEWLSEARERRAKFAARIGLVYWRLVETGEPIPGDAIPTGNEGGAQIFSIRVWKDGGLTIGKQVPAILWNSTRTSTGPPQFVESSF